MSKEFDPYYEWLGIPAAEQPPNHYRLLGIPLFENSAEVIANGGIRQMSFLRGIQANKLQIQVQRLLNEVAKAKVCCGSRAAGRLRQTTACQAAPGTGSSGTAYDSYHSHDRFAASNRITVSRPSIGRETGRLRPATGLTDHWQRTRL